MNDSQSWYIVKRNEGHCEILPKEKVEGKEDPNIVERWGPYGSPDEAIAKRVGLIRAGKCKPV